MTRTPFLAHTEFLRTSMCVYLKLKRVLAKLASSDTYCINKLMTRLIVQLGIHPKRMPATQSKFTRSDNCQFLAYLFIPLITILLLLLWLLQHTNTFSQLCRHFYTGLKQARQALLTQALRLYCPVLAALLSL